MTRPKERGSIAAGGRVDRRGRPRAPSARTVADLRALVDLYAGVVPLHEARRVLGRSATASERRVVGVRLVGDALVSIPRGGPPGSVGVSSSEARRVSLVEER